jgi:hypothetical protein
VKKIHTYLGLLNLTLVLVFGIVGLIAASQQGDRGAPPIASQSDLAYTPPANATDRQVAADLYRFLRPQLAWPPGDAAAHRDPDRNLVVRFYTANGPIQVTVLEKEHRLHVERRRNTLGQFLSNIHSVTLLDTSGALDWRLRLWACYTEISIWSLLGMAVSGPLLWLSSRPRFPLAWLSFGAGAVLFVALYLLVR